MKYGLPYMGSKNKLAERICDLFPYRKNFYDLFCGGCAVTHCALVKNMFDRYVINDINSMPVNLFYNACMGKYKNENRWISKEDFKRLMNEDEYAACCFSFGNDYQTYCYSEKIEPYKKACHYAIVFDEWDQLKELCPEVFDSAFHALQGLTDTKQRRILFGKAIVRRLKEIGNWNIVINNPLYKSCHWRGGFFGVGQANKGGQDLELQSLQSLERLEKYTGDYRKIPIEPDSVIYCDIPYEKTNKYKMPDFDYNAFYDWCEKQTEPLFVSSYSLPEDKFREIAAFEHRCTRNTQNNNSVVEKIFIPNHQQDYRNFLF